MLIYSKQVKSAGITVVVRLNLYFSACSSFLPGKCSKLKKKLKIKSFLNRAKQETRGMIFKMKILQNKQEKQTCQEWKKTNKQSKTRLGS